MRDAQPFETAAGERALYLIPRTLMQSIAR